MLAPNSARFPSFLGTAVADGPRPQKSMPLCVNNWCKKKTQSAIFYFKEKDWKGKQRKIKCLRITVYRVAHIRVCTRTTYYSVLRIDAKVWCPWGSKPNFLSVSLSASKLALITPYKTTMHVTYKKFLKSIVPLENRNLTIFSL